MSDAHRFARHLVLSEIGPEGQAKFNAMECHVPPGRSGDVAADYLQRAGATIRDGSNVIPISTTTETPQNRIAVDTLHGILGALEALRRELGMPSHEPLGLDSK